MTEQILRNIASNYARMLFGIVTTLFLMPLILGKLGPEALGLWVLVNTVAGYFGLTDLGITSAAIKYISHYRATEQWDELNRTIGTSQACFGIFAVVVFILGLILGQLAPSLFQLSPASIPECRIMMVIIGGVAAIGFMSVIPIQCAIAAQRQDLLNMWMLVLQVVTTCISLAVVYRGGGIVTLAAIQLVSSVGNGLIGLILTRRYLPQAKLRISWHKDLAVLLASFAGFAFVATVAGRVIYYSDTLVIAHCLTVAAVAAYAIALRIGDFMRAVVNSGSGVLGTFICDLSARQDQESLATMWIEGAKWSVAMALPIYLLCVLLGSDLITGWLNRPYPEAVAVLAILVLGNVFDLAQSVGFQILVNGGKIRVYTVIVFAEACMNITLSLVLIKHFGIVGVAIGTVIPQILRSAVVCPILLFRTTGVRVVRYLKQAILPAVSAALPSMTVICIYKFCALHSGRTSLCLLALSLCITELVGMYYFCLGPNQRARLKQSLSKKRSEDLTSSPALVALESAE